MADPVTTTKPASTVEELEARLEAEVQKFATKSKTNKYIAMAALILAAVAAGVLGFPTASQRFSNDAAQVGTIKVETATLTIASPTEPPAELVTPTTPEE